MPRRHPGPGRLPGAGGALFPFRDDFFLGVQNFQKSCWLKLTLILGPLVPLPFSPFFSLFLFLFLRQERPRGRPIPGSAYKSPTQRA